MHILIIDDQDISREGVTNIVSKTIPAAGLDEAHDALEVEKLLAANEYDLAILETDLASGAGEEILRGICTRHTGVRVLVLSGRRETSHAGRALRLGARGVIGKDARAGELIEAIRSILSGRRYVSESLAGDLAATLARKHTASAKQNLSSRERSIAAALARGERLTDAAHGLGISVKTAGTYRTRALAKLGLKNNADLVREAQALGLLADGK